MAKTNIETKKRIYNWAKLHTPKKLVVGRCPNCGKLNNGQKSSDGRVRYECQKCKTLTYSHEILKIITLMLFILSGLLAVINLYYSVYLFINIPLI